jgi:hypothetical protein
MTRTQQAHTIQLEKQDRKLTKVAQVTEDEKSPHVGDEDFSQSTHLWGAIF